MSRARGTSVQPLSGTSSTQWLMTSPSTPHVSNGPGCQVLYEVLNRTEGRCLLRRHHLDHPWEVCVLSLSPSGAP